MQQALQNALTDLRFGWFPRQASGDIVLVSLSGANRDKALGEDTFNRIQPGMTKDEVLRLIGPPGETMHFARTNTNAWDYRFIDQWGYPAIFSVILDGAGGKVVSKFTQRIERDKAR